MLCHQLITIVGNSQLLLKGSFFVTEPVRSDLHEWELDRMHEGKDSSINHMLAGGNGFPECNLQTHMARACFDVGVKRERDDMRALSFWQASLRNCLADRYRRFEV